MDVDVGIKNLIAEIKVHWVLDQCEGILRLIEIYEDTENVYLVLDYQSRGSLLNKIKNKHEFSEKQIRSIMEQLLLTIDFIHQKKIIHRDIKLDNILINQIEGDEFDVRIADFGLAIFTEKDEMIKDKCGTPSYVAPEILRSVGYSYKSDIFSLGSLFFNLITGRYLFNGKDR